jgi:hypothetical protein
MEIKDRDRGVTFKDVRKTKSLKVLATPHVARDRRWSPWRIGAERPGRHDRPDTCEAGVLGVHWTHLGDTATAEHVSFMRATHRIKQPPSTDLPPFIHALLLAIAMSAIVGWALTQLIP